MLEVAIHAWMVSEESEASNGWPSYSLVDAERIFAEAEARTVFKKKSRLIEGSLLIVAREEGLSKKSRLITWGGVLDAVAGAGLSKNSMSILSGMLANC